MTSKRRWTKRLFLFVLMVAAIIYVAMIIDFIIKERKTNAFTFNASGLSAPSNPRPLNIREER